MNASELIAKLKERGLSEYAIAKRLKNTGSPVSQSTINRIANGETENPGYRVWRALEELHSDVTAPRDERASSALSS